jgi:hypothetical protein
MSRFLSAAGVAFVLAAALMCSSSAFAWGTSGHRLIGDLAVRSLPLELPVFLRKREAARQIAEVAREPDRFKGSGGPAESDSSAAHYVSVGDDLKIARGPTLETLPATRESYDAALRAAGSNQYRAGYLPYAIIEAWQRVVMDFAYWRADFAGERYAKTPAERTWFLQDQWIREGITVRDLGYLAHFIGEGSEPLNVSVHSDGWGNYPNPRGFAAAKGVRAAFEGTVVSGRIADKDLLPRVAAYHDCHCSIEQRVAQYLAATQKDVTALYEIERAGGFKENDAKGRDFVSLRLAAAISEMRDLIGLAWLKSGEVSVGYPPIAVRDIESGTTNALDAMRGVD